MRLHDEPIFALMQRWLETYTGHPSVWLDAWQTASANELSLHTTDTTQVNNDEQTLNR